MNDEMHRLSDIPTFKEFFDNFKNNEVILERLNNLINKNSEEHQKITEQVKSTNGTVAEINKWRWMMVGAMTFILLCILPIVFAFANSYFSR